MKDTFFIEPIEAKLVLRTHTSTVQIRTMLNKKPTIYVICQGKTTYRGFTVGYLKNCSIECRDKNKTIKHDYWKGKPQSKEHVEKRILNTNQELKQTNWERSIFEKYGVDNPSKLENVKDKISIGNKGKIVNRDSEWQQKIIDSKRKNGTLKHSDETRIKISDSLNEHFKENALIFEESYCISAKFTDYVIERL
jgi:hypothetical protein